jgi:hypothetical protein
MFDHVEVVVMSPYESVASSYAIDELVYMSLDASGVTLNVIG